MDTVNHPVVTEWLSIGQLCWLLTHGEITIASSGGTLHLCVNECDRVAAQELAEN